MFSKTNLLAVALSLGCCLSAQAKTLYVATNGNDGVTYAANSSSNPWKTIGRAAWGSTSYASPNTSQAAQAGDTVLISAGIYWENGSSPGSRFTVSLNPANSGTSASPIIFRGVGLVYVRMNSGYRGAMIGCCVEEIRHLGQFPDRRLLRRKHVGHRARGVFQFGLLPGHQ